MIGTVRCGDCGAVLSISPLAPDAVARRGAAEFIAAHSASGRCGTLRWIRDNVKPPIVLAALVRMGLDDTIERAIEAQIAALFAKGLP